MLSGQYFSTSASNNITGLQLCLWGEEQTSQVLFHIDRKDANIFIQTYHFWKGALNSRASKWPDTDVMVTVTF